MAEALDAAIPARVDALARRVLDEACARRLKLVTAESCTGGLLASLLTDIPGCSHAFERGFVTYSNDAKRELLGVPAGLLESPGPVSEEVALAMAEGALRNSRGDISLAVTGFADASPGGEAGLVHFAVGRRGAAARHSRQRFGPLGRAQVRIRSLEVSLRLIFEAMNGQRP
jgi:nicotinamide-nucleotide amidase